MAIIKNDIGPISVRSVINVTLIIAVLVIVGLVVYKQLARLLYPAQVDKNRCPDDPNYEYKDPHKHPDC